MDINSSSVRARFGMQFVGLARRWRRALDQHLASIGLTDATWAPLVHLYEGGDGIQQKVLAERLGLGGPGLVRLLDVLCAQGLVERRSDDPDRRAKRIYLTESGRRRVVDIQRALREAEAVLLADLGDAEIAMLMQAFARIDLRVAQFLEPTPSTP